MLMPPRNIAFLFELPFHSAKFGSAYQNAATAAEPLMVILVEESGATLGDIATLCLDLRQRREYPANAQCAAQSSTAIDMHIRP